MRPPRPFLDWKVVRLASQTTRETSSGNVLPSKAAWRLSVLRSTDWSFQDSLYRIEERAKASRRTSQWSAMRVTSQQIAHGAWFRKLGSLGQTPSSRSSSKKVSCRQCGLTTSGLGLSALASVWSGSVMSALASASASTVVCVLGGCSSPSASEKAPRSKGRPAVVRRRHIKWPVTD